MPDWYPESELERHGLTPGDWNRPGCYALSLDTPDFAIRFAERWDDHYDVSAPSGLSSAIQGGYDIVYVGATAHLRDRLQDHADGDVRQAGVCAVCPPTGVVAVWPEDTAALAFERERRRAVAYREAHDGVAVVCNGEVV